jgi:Secretion system C-terminal sorting domain
MTKGTKVLMLLLLFSCTNVFSQQLSQQVLVPAAGQATSGVINYSQTIGETAVEIINSSGFILTQGFQQPGIKISTEIPHEGNGIDVYPNPATDFINVKMFGDVARKFRIEIINITGTIISSLTRDFITNFYYIEQIDVTDLKLGFYFVRVTSDDGIISRVFKIEKM